MGCALSKVYGIFASSIRGIMKFKGRKITAKVKMKQIIVGGLVLPLLAVLSGVTTQPASAVSDFDTTLLLTESLEISANNYYGYTCTAENIEDTWADLIVQNAPESAVASFNNKMSWAVKSEFLDYGSMNTQSVRVYWSETPAFGDFSGYSPDGGTTWYRGVGFTADSVHSIMIANQVVANGMPGCGATVSEYAVANGYEYPLTGFTTQANAPYWPVYNDPLSFGGFHHYLSHNYTDSSKVFLASNVTFRFPPDYAGPRLEDNSDIDNDQDGLSLAQENSQGTDDNNPDTDGDGIDDLKESVWFSDRDEVFCNIASATRECAYPNPIVQDVYLEIDWMKDPSSKKIAKPSGAQLLLIEKMFKNKGINFYADAGRYGGGQELKKYTPVLKHDSKQGAVDFNDYKIGGDGIDRNFAEKRLGVWRYMIYGNKYSTPGGPSDHIGWAEALGDDMFIAGGIISDIKNVANADLAVASIIAHEIGHSLCLTNSRIYNEQGQECAYGGIDNDSGYKPDRRADEWFNLPNYKSIMNYRYHLTNKGNMGSVDYSSGVNGSGDRDDWTPVKRHMGLFNKQKNILGGAPLANGTKSADGLVIVESSPPLK